MKIFIILYIAFAGASALSADLKVSDVFEDKGSLVVETKDGMHKVDVEQIMEQGPGYEIKLNQRSFLDGNKRILRRQLKLEEEIELKKLQYEAQTAYEKRDYSSAWSKVNQAQEIDPWSTQLMNMKGSILYLTGSPELAIAYWKESLKIHDNQPFLKTTIDRITATLKKGVKP